MKFSNNIGRMRKNIHMSQEELAEIVGVSRQSVSRWETGYSQPGIKNILILSNIFGSSTDFLLNNEKVNKK